MIRTSSIRFLSAVFISVFVIAFVGGCAGENDQAPQEPEPEQTPATAPEPEPEQRTDSFGRDPSDPHFGHNHPPRGQNPTNNPGSGQTDQYGRQPGDPHYGHNHP